jgi:hypothetical protein
MSRQLLDNVNLHNLRNASPLPKRVWYAKCKAGQPMETAGRTIAKMWKHSGGYECYVKKRGDDWMLTLEQSGRILHESKVESPGEAIRKSDDLHRTVTKEIGQSDGSVHL